MSTLKKSQDLLKQMNPAISQDFFNESNYINFFKTISLNQKTQNVSKLWFRNKEVVDIINLILANYYYSDSIISITGSEGSGKTDILHTIAYSIEHLFIDTIFIDKPENILIDQKYAENLFDHIKNVNNKNTKAQGKILLIIDNYSNILRHDPTDIDRTTHSILDNYLLNFDNVCSLVSVLDIHSQKFNNHLFKDKFINYNIESLNKNQIKDIIISRINHNNLPENYIELTEKLIEMSHYIKKPNIKKFVKILNLLKVKFSKDYEDFITNKNEFTQDREKVNTDNLYKCLTVFSNYSYDEIKNSGKFEFSRENINKEIDKNIILSEYNKNYVTNIIAKKLLKLHDKTRPLGTIMAVGPTGTGKTLLAKVLAKLCYGSEDKIVRLNMNEMSSGHHVNKILGSAPGYVGYKDGTILTKGLEKHYPSVILMDEIEKCHIEVLNAFLTMLDEGFFTDGSGVKYDVSECIIIMTSNSLALDFQKNNAGALGFDLDIDTTIISKDHDQKKYIEKINMYKSKIISNGFPPEFINRIDGFLLFPKLEKEQLTGIFLQQIKEINSYFPKVKIEINNDSIVEYLHDKINPEEGGRSSKKIIQNIILPSIMDKLIDNPTSNLITFSSNDINGAYI